MSVSDPDYDSHDVIVVAAWGASSVMLRPLSTAAKEWVSANVDSESWQWLGGALCVHHRYAPGIIQAMTDHGLEVQVVR